MHWREAVYRVFEAIARNESPPGDDWGTVETSIQNAISGAVLSRDKAGVTSWKTSQGTIDLTTIPQRLALGLHELLASGLVANLSSARVVRGCLSIRPRITGGAGAQWLPAVTERKRSGIIRPKQHQIEQSIRLAYTSVKVLSRDLFRNSSFVGAQPVFFRCPRSVN